MIKNIIFDLGNVLMNFQPREYLADSGMNTEDIEFIFHEIYESKEWVELDRGTISQKTAIDLICSRNPGKEKLLRENSNFHPVLTPININVEILKKLKDRQYKLYYLTNYHDELFDYSFKKYDFFQLFDGGVVSAHVKQIKPDPEIYKTLINNYELKVNETIFIDDSLKNTVAAEKLGIESIHLENPLLLQPLLEQKFNIKL